MLGLYLVWQLVLWKWRYSFYIINCDTSAKENEKLINTDILIRLTELAQLLKFNCSVFNT